MNSDSYFIAVYRIVFNIDLYFHVIMYQICPDSTNLIHKL